MSNTICKTGQGGRGFERFDAQESALERLRQFASARNVHITLVIHPRKESAESKLSMNSIFGTAKATQEADNVFILQAVPKHGGASGGGNYSRSNHKGNTDEDDTTLVKSLDVKKNRFDGKLGCIPLDFDEFSLVYSEKGSIHGKSMSVPQPPALSEQNQQLTTQQPKEQNTQLPTNASEFPVADGEDVNIVPVDEEEAFTILTK